MLLNSQMHEFYAAIDHMKMDVISRANLTHYGRTVVLTLLNPAWLYLRKIEIAEVAHWKTRFVFEMTYRGLDMQFYEEIDQTEARPWFEQIMQDSGLVEGEANECAVFVLRRLAAVLLALSAGSHLWSLAPRDTSWVCSLWDCAPGQACVAILSRDAKIREMEGIATEHYDKEYRKLAERFRKCIREAVPRYSA